MAIFNSPEEFEAYLAEQQANEERALAAQAGAEKRPRAASDFWVRNLNLMIMLGALCACGYFFYTTQSEHRNKSNDPWDNILGMAAWLGNAEYDADADDLTKRLTFKPKRKE